MVSFPLKEHPPRNPPGKLSSSTFFKEASVHDEVHILFRVSSRRFSRIQVHHAGKSYINLIRLRIVEISLILLEGSQTVPHLNGSFSLPVCTSCDANPSYQDNIGELSGHGPNNSTLRMFASVLNSLHLCLSLLPEKERSDHGYDCYDLLEPLCSIAEILAPNTVKVRDKDAKEDQGPRQQLIGDSTKHPKKRSKNFETPQVKGMPKR